MEEGAIGIGDELMVTGHVREMYARDPRRVRLEYGGKRVWNDIFLNNPKIAGYDERGDFQVYRARMNGLRPYAKEKTERRWVWRDDYTPRVGEIFFTRRELAWAERMDPGIIVEPNCKRSASVNKDWGWERWAELVRLLGLAGLKVTQVGPHGTRRVSGAEFIETTTFRHAAAVLSHARAAVLPEGGLHHAAAALGVRSVVIYGGYISPKQTGYDLHCNLFTGGEPCGMRVECEHCKRAMSEITPELVFESAKALLT